MVDALADEEVAGDSSSDAKEGNQELQETGSDDSETGFAVRPGGQRALYDELVGTPLEEVHENEPGQYA